MFLILKQNTGWVQQSSWQKHLHTSGLRVAARGRYEARCPQYNSSSLSHRWQPITSWSLCNILDECLFFLKKFLFSTWKLKLVPTPHIIRDHKQAKGWNIFVSQVGSRGREQIEGSIFESVYFEADDSTHFSWRGTRTRKGTDCISWETSKGVSR